MGRGYIDTHNRASTCLVMGDMDGFIAETGAMDELCQRLWRALERLSHECNAWTHPKLATTEMRDVLLYADEVLTDARGDQVWDDLAKT